MSQSGVNFKYDALKDYLFAKYIHISVFLSNDYVCLSYIFYCSTVQTQDAEVSIFLHPIQFYKSEKYLLIMSNSQFYSAIKLYSDDIYLPRPPLKRMQRKQKRTTR